MEKRNEFRSLRLETRVDEKQEGGKKLVLRGYPILFNTETKIFDFWYGEIRETILPTALEGTNLNDVYLVGGHQVTPEKVLARNNINMRMEVDETGLFFEAELPNTQYARDIYNLVESGLVDGMSFGFTCSDEVNEATAIRTITHIDELYEITITPFPAYKEASVIAQRQQADKEQKKADEEKAKAEAEERAEQERLEAERKAEQERLEAEQKAERENKLKELEGLLDD